jgi:hypothetical protein
MPQVVNKQVEMELEGLDGNAMVILGTWAKNARRQGWTEAEIKKVTTEAKKKDYDHLLQTIILHST